MHCYNRSLMYRNVETCTMKIDLVKQLFQFFDQTDTEYGSIRPKSMKLTSLLIRCDQEPTDLRCIKYKNINSG